MGRIAAAAMLGGVVWFVAGAIHATRPELHPDLVQTPVERLIISLFAAALVLIAPGLLLLGRFARSPLGARVAATGTLLLAATATSSNVRGGDASWFIVAAPVSNLLWFGGMVVLAVSLWHAGRVPRAVAVMLPVGWIFALPLSFIGGPLVTGAYWLAVGGMLAAGTLARPAPAPGASVVAR